MPVVLNITSATVIKAAPGNINWVSVLVAGSAAGTLNDCATTGAAASSNAIAALPNAVGNQDYFKPRRCGTGIVVTPGSGQTIAIGYDETLA